ncbi:MAG: oligosaccharide flippase family protein [Gemmatimonadaceae bacterium]|nr:oligosaccharide flippase family protein [Gemmatimonadaceae bacterium]
MTEAPERRLSQQVGVVVAARIASTLVDISTAVATARLLSKTDFAVLSYLLILYQVLRYLAMMGFPDSVFYFFERLSGSARRAICLQTFLVLAATAAGAGGLLLLSSHAVPHLVSDDWTGGNVQDLQRFLPWLALVAVLEIPTWPAMNVLLASGRHRHAALYEVLFSVLTFAGLIGPLALGYSLRYALIGLAVYAAVRLIVSVTWVWLVLPASTLRPRPGLLGEQVRFAIPLGSSLLVNRMNRYADKFVVGAMLTPAALAEYNIASQEIPLVAVLPYAVGTVLITRYVRLVKDDRRQELLELWYKGIRKMSLFVVPITVLLIAIAPEAIPLIFGRENYEAAIRPFQICTTVLLLRVASFSSILQSFGDTRAVLWVALSRFAGNVALTIPFTLWWGTVGTAGATALASFLNLFHILAILSRHMQLPAHRVLPFGYYGKVLAVALASAGATWGLRLLHVLPLEEVPRMGATVVAYGVVFLVVGSLTGVISREDRGHLRDWLSLKYLR